MKTIKSFLHGSRKKYFVAIALSLLLSIEAGYSFNTQVSLKKKPFYPIVEWVLDKTVSNVDFYHAIVLCNDKNTVLLKFVNRNARSVKIAWKETFVTKTNEQKDGFAGTKELTIPPGITTPSDCSDTNIGQAIIRPGEVDPASLVEISNFIFRDITVSNP